MVDGTRQLSSHPLRRGVFVRLVLHGRPTSRVGRIIRTHTDGDYVVDMFGERALGGGHHHETVSARMLQPITRSEAEALS